MAAGSPAAGQSTDSVTTSATPSDVTMRMRLEKTLFRVDVLALELRFGTGDAGRLRALVAGRRWSRPLADSVAVAAVSARDAVATITFSRDIGLDRFLDGIVDNLRHAVRDGIVADSARARIERGLPEWYAPLAGRDIERGDRMVYRIRGDTLRATYHSVSGEVLVDRVDVGESAPRTVLGGYFARGSDFREGLIRSILR